MPGCRQVRPGPARSLNRVVETMNETLTNRIALVTGGGRGIGQAISLGLAERGARVAVLARSAGQVHQTAGLITGRGGQAIALPADVADPDQIAAALAAIGQRWQPAGHRGYGRTRRRLERSMRSAARAAAVLAVGHAAVRARAECLGDG